MKKWPQLPVFTLGWCVFNGCNSVTDTVFTQSCNVAEDAICYDYPASDTEISRNCSVHEQGTYSTSLCPTANRVGSCFFNDGSKAVRYYSTGSGVSAWSTDSARSNCNVGPFVEN
ncbi:MAG: hypothetical protein AB7P04_09760 [Bacteriovoracia bacterium]